MNLPETPSSTPRREFLRDALRYSVLAGIGGLVATAIARRAPLASTGSCPGAGECSRCALSSGCTLPQATGTDAKNSPNKAKS